MNIPRKLALPLDYSGAALFFALCMVAAYHGLALLCIASGLATVAFAMSAYWWNLDGRGFRDNGVFATCRVLAVLSAVFFLLALISWVLS